MTEQIRKWKVIIHEWAEYAVHVEGRTKEEAEARAVEDYDGLDCFDSGIDWADAGEEE